MATQAKLHSSAVPRLCSQFLPQNLKPSQCSLPSSATQRHGLLTARASGKGPDGLGDWGARDPYAGEVESNFGEKVLGNYDTEHRILFPAGLDELVGLATRSCQPLDESAEAMSEQEARELLKRVVGWRLLPLATNGSSSSLQLQGQWRVRGESAGQELLQRIRDLAEQQGQSPEMRYDDGSKSVIADIHSQSVGGLTANDFIFAAKIDKLDIKDLVAKARFWA